MVYEVRHPVDIPGVISFTSVHDGKKKYDLHGAYAGQVIKQVAGEGVALFTAVSLDDAVKNAMALNIRIISASLRTPKTAKREALLKKYYNWGGVFVAAAGNDDSRGVTFPANSPYAIAVSATNDEDCNGPEIDVTADSWWTVIRPPGITYDSFSGTSCATPVISACVALILEKYPDWKTEEVRQFLRENSVPGNEEYERIFSFPDNFGKEVKKVPEYRANTNRIVVHHSASPLSWDIKDIDANHKAKGCYMAGYHRVITPNGTVQQGRPDWAIGAHAYGANNDSIGICLIGNFETGEPTEAQMDSLIKEILRLQISYGDIPVIGHCEVDPVNYPTACPGKNFDMDKLRSAISKEKEGDSVEDWMKKMGEEAVDYLVKEGIIKNPEYWIPKLDENVPNWLFFSLLKRLDERRG